VALRLYKALDYGAVCVSNHDLYTDTTMLDDGGMYLMQGVEYSRDEHMLTLGVNKSLHNLPHQEAIDETASLGGFTVLCHPNWQRKAYWPSEKLAALKNYAGIEVINMLIYRLSGSGLASDIWDDLLRKGMLVYGFGNDDFHMPFDAGRGFTHLYIYGSGYDAIKKAVDSGMFTASSGIGLDYLHCEDGMITVKAKFLTETYANCFVYRFINENGLASRQAGATAEYALAGENYVRIEVYAENGAMLFTQPVWKEGFFENGE
jgi:hypothetical protein